MFTIVVTAIIVLHMCVELCLNRCGYASANIERPEVHLWNSFFCPLTCVRWWLNSLETHLLNFAGIVNICVFGIYMWLDVYMHLRTCEGQRETVKLILFSPVSSGRECRVPGLYHSSSSLLRQLAHLTLRNSHFTSSFSLFFWRL